MSEGNSQFESTHFAGDYRLGKVEILTSSGKKIDMSNLVVEMNIYESIFRPNMEGNLVILDSHNHIDNLPIIGQEQISFKLHRPGVNMESIDFETHRGRIYKVDSIVKTREREKSYMVHFTTTDAYRDAHTKVSRAYTGNISDICSKILKNDLGVKKSIATELAAESTKYVGVFKRPYEVINQLIKKATSPRHGHGFLFFENHRGYNIRSLGSLTHTQDGKPKLPVAQFNEGLVDREGVIKYIELDMKTMRSVQIKNTHDTNADLRAGGLAIKHYIHDTYKKSVSTTSYNYLKEYDDEKHTDENSNPLYSNTFEDINTKKSLSDYDESRIMVSPNSLNLHSDMTTTHNVNKSRNHARRIMYDTLKLSAVVAGHSEIAAGAVVELLMNARQPVEKEGDTVESKKLSGRWLVNSLVHTVTKNEYTITMDCSKDSVAQPYDSLDESIDSMFSPSNETSQNTTID